MDLYLKYLKNPKTWNLFTSWYRPNYKDQTQNCMLYAECRSGIFTGGEGEETGGSWYDAPPDDWGCWCKQEEVASRSKGVGEAMGEFQSPSWDQSSGRLQRLRYSFSCQSFCHLLPKQFWKTVLWFMRSLPLWYLLVYRGMQGMLFFVGSCLGI